MSLPSSPTSHEFTFIVDGANLDDERVIDALYDAGCDDALVSSDSGVQSIDFEREAPSLHQAILSAIADVESVAGLHVVRVVDIDLLSMSALARRTGRTRESIRLYAKGRRGPGGFPPPVNRHEDGRYHLWRWSDVADWLERHKIKGFDTLSGHRNTLIVINAALDLRSHGQSMEPATRAELRKLVAEGLAA